jgi:predicted DNA-binding transcriptional regulator YafY
MADTSIRYLAMLQTIPRYPLTINTSDIQTRLADQGFEINVRSIQRDLEKLSVYYPLIVDEGVRPYAWSFDVNAASRMLPMLDVPAALTFELAYAYLKPVLPGKVLSHLEPHFREAREVLKRNGNPLSHWPEKIRVITRGLSSKRPAVDAEVLENLTQALLDNQRCEIIYQGRRWKAPEKIIINPLAMVFREPNTYLITTIEGREHVRQLVLHRIQHVKVLAEPVQRPADFDVDKFIDNGEMHVLNSNQQISLKLRCDKPQLLQLIESPIGVDQDIYTDNETFFELTVTLADSQDLRWWLLAQSSHVDIIEPEWLKYEIENELERALKRIKT